MNWMSAPHKRADVARTILIIVAAAMVGLFLGNLIGKLSRPYRQLWRQRSELRELTAEVEAKRHEQQQLLREIAKINTQEGMIVEARRFGYLRPGERMLRYVKPEHWPRTERARPPASRLSRLKEKVHCVLDKRERSKGGQVPRTPLPD
ncbi:hypothetical protein AMK68_03155 [candidate division KD3-62 bacterium DG_56]|uniref:Uncharacterized protein n=1 Tax=candidate division KD3-62 bacterium DG_56 TaxID=1704032 RepID=A0A0S7XMX8_9BACT|nr:MAG: hypothetical protein AMK68_03155 [candidate division KD3-62 bacterium DG_56]